VTHPLVSYYDELLTDADLREGMGWCVVEGIDAPVSLADAVRRLGVDPSELTEVDLEEVIDGPPCDSVICIADHARGVALFEYGGREVVRFEVMRRLSAGARVHSTSWHFNGGDTMMYAAYGQLLTGLKTEYPKDRWGERPDALDDDLRAVGGFALEDDLGPRPAGHPGVVALAAIELRTGVRPTLEWLKGRLTAVRIARPVPDDPRPSTPFGRLDPDLDAWLRVAPEEVRRAAVRHALRRVVDRFDVADDPVVSLMLGAVEAGTPMPEGPERDAVHHRLRAMDPSASDASTRRARSALVTALASPALWRSPLDELWMVKDAVGDEWPALRAELVAIARRRSG